MSGFFEMHLHLRCIQIRISTDCIDGAFPGLFFLIRLVSVFDQTFARTAAFYSFFYYSSYIKFLVAVKGNKSWL